MTFDYEGIEKSEELEEQKMPGKNLEQTETPETPVEAERPGEGNEAADETTGYSSEYYKHEMAVAIKNGSNIGFETARKNYAKALARETTGAASETHETGETKEPAEQESEATGYSSDYYKWQMASAIKNGSNIGYETAKKNYAKALVRETTGAATETQKIGEAKESSEPESETTGYLSDYDKLQRAMGIKKNSPMTVTTYPE